MGRLPAAWFAALVLASPGDLMPAAVAAEAVGSAVRAAATANGQTIATIDASRGAIMAFDAARPEARRDLIEPPPADTVAFVAVGYLTGDVLAAVCRTGDDWSLCTYRTAPDQPVSAASPLQRITIGTASGPSDLVDLAVSHARGWLAVTGLPAPLPPVLRAAVAGVRVGPLSDRGCPVPDPSRRPVASAVSPADELVLVLRPAAAASRTPAGDEIAFHDLTGREVLRLPAGVREIAGLEFGRGDGTLWAAAVDAPGRAGLWRLDAALADGRQVIRPSLAAPLESPRDLVCSSPRAIAVAHGGPPIRITIIDPSTLQPSDTPRADP